MRILDRQDAAVHMSDEILSRGEPLVMTTFGNSMRRLIYPGERIVVQKFDNPEFEIGDIVLFGARMDQRFLVHRVVDREMIDGKLSIWTKGDSSPRDCIPNDPQLYHGTVIAVQKKGGFVVDVRTPLWRIIGKVAAKLSDWNGRFSEGWLFYHKTRRGEQVFPQRILELVLRQIVKLTTYLTRRRMQPEAH